MHLSQCTRAIRPWRGIREGVARLQGRQVELTTAVHILKFILCMGIVKIILQIQITFQNLQQKKILAVKKNVIYTVSPWKGKKKSSHCRSV